MERWRQWTPPAFVEDDPNEIIVEEDGHRSRAVNVTYPLEVVERIRSGYLCLKCQEPLETPFPEKCPMPLCGYEIRSRQSEDFAKEFRGLTWIGPKVTPEEELADLQERSERRTAGKRKDSSIAVPRDVNRTSGGVVLPPGVNAS